MRNLLLLLLVACADTSCTSDEATPDAAVTSGDVLDGSSSAEYWPCYFWGDTSTTVSRCSPKCSNATLLGREAWGADNTCEYSAGLLCPPERMTGPKYAENAGCCVYVAGDHERVEFVECL